jgi:hypothetical protein
MSDRTKSRLRRVGLFGGFASFVIGAYFTGWLLVQSVNADSGSGVLNENTLLPIGFVGIALVTVWRASSAFKGLCDSVDSLKKELTDHRCNRCDAFKEKS